MPRVTLSLASFISEFNEFFSIYRDEIRELRSKTGKVKSLEVRLEWLEGSVAETRGQVSELGAALEKTNIIPIKMHSVQSELRAQADQLQQFSQQLATLNSEVREH
jgi:chromosome segregation ATPase